MKFSDIIGQQELKAHLQGAVKRSSPRQAYIFEGEKYSGKKMLAGVFAAALQCEKGGIEPCGECHYCKMAQSGSHPDIIRVNHERPNEIVVDEIREQLVEDVSLRPYYGPYKIYIIDEADRMNMAAQNAVLKTLEDPPEYIVILLLAERIQAFLPTILSRCMKLSVTPLSDEQIKNYLMRSHRLPEYEAAMITAFAAGNLGKADRLASGEEFGGMRSSVAELLSHIDEQPADWLMDKAEQIVSEYKGRESELFDFFVIWYRDVLLYKALNDKERLIWQEESYTISREAAGMSYKRLLICFEDISSARKQLAARVTAPRVMQQLLIRLSGYADHGEYK